MLSLFAISGLLYMTNSGNFIPCFIYFTIAGLPTNFILVSSVSLQTLGMQSPCIVVVRIFNATRHPRHIEAVAIVMYMYLYSLAFMDHPCTLGAAVCYQALPCPLYTQLRARQVWARHTNGLKIVSTRAGLEPTISRLKVERPNH